MGNCLSSCSARSSGNGGETVISYAGGKFYQTTKEQAPCLDAKAQSPCEKQVREYAIVQKELEALQSQITHSQAVLASLKFTFLEASAIRKNLDKVNRTTQTFQDSQPKSLENVSATGVRDRSGWQQLTSSCPSIVHNIAVQTDCLDVTKLTVNDAEYFLPPIGSPLDAKLCNLLFYLLQSLKDHRQTAPNDPPNSIDLDVYRSCRKLSVLPEEEMTGEDSPPGSRLAIAFYPDQQSHSFESYLLPGSGVPQVIRQLSDPTTSRSTRRPLQISTSGCPISEARAGVQDSGLGSEVRIPSPTFTTLQDTLTQLVTISYSSDPDLEPVITLRTPAPMSPDGLFQTPPDITPNSPNQNSSSDTSLSFQTPTEITPGTESPVERLPLDRHSLSSPVPEKPPSLVVPPVEDQPLPPPPPQALDAPNEGPLRRVPSKRGKVPLIRSLARTDSNKGLDLSAVPSQDSNGSNSTKDKTSANLEPCQIKSSVLDSDQSKQNGISTKVSSSVAETAPSVSKNPNTFNCTSPSTNVNLPVTVNGSYTRATKNQSPTSGGDISLSITRKSGYPAVKALGSPSECSEKNKAEGSELELTIGEHPKSSVAAVLEAMEAELKRIDISRISNVTVESKANEEKNGLGMDNQENQAVFPSLSDAALKQLGVYLQANSADEKEVQLTEADVENKYTSLVLAFKTDKLTLTRRLELQNKLRDQAEINMTHEFDALKSAIQVLSTIAVDAEKAEMFDKIRQQVDTLYKATLRVSSTAEMYGAVQQENRLSKAVDIVLKHVDSLKLAYEKEKGDHEETKKLVQKETKPVSPAVSALKNSGKRRASIATLHQIRSQTDGVFGSAERRGSSSRRGSRSQLKRTNTNKDDIKIEPSLENGNGEILDDISEKLDRRCSIHPDELGLSGVSQANTTENETDTEDELYYRRLQQRKDEIEIQKRLPNRYKFRKRSSFCAPSWVMKVMAYLHWLQPYEDFALQARYALAGLFVVTAIGIVISNFFVTQES